MVLIKVINSINSPYNGWFLPAIQRPYVWGSRHENELYICKLFDSISILFNSEFSCPSSNNAKAYLPAAISEKSLFELKIIPF